MTCRILNLYFLLYLPQNIPYYYYIMYIICIPNTRTVYTTFSMGKVFDLKFVTKTEKKFKKIYWNYFPSQKLYFMFDLVKKFLVSFFIRDFF